MKRHYILVSVETSEDVKSKELSEYFHNILSTTPNRFYYIFSTRVRYIPLHRLAYPKSKLKSL